MFRMEYLSQAMERKPVRSAPRGGGSTRPSQPPELQWTFEIAHKGMWENSGSVGSRQGLASQPPPQFRNRPCPSVGIEACKDGRGKRHSATTSDSARCQAASTSTVRQYRNLSLLCQAENDFLNFRKTCHCRNSLSGRELCALRREKMCRPIPAKHLRWDRSPAGPSARGPPVHSER